MPGIEDEADFTDDNPEASSDDFADAVAPRDHRTLLQGIVDSDPDGDFGRLAAGALEALIAREDAAVRDAALVAAAAEVTPFGIAETMARYEAVVAQGMDADQEELTLASLAVADLKASLRADTERGLAEDLQSYYEQILKGQLAKGVDEDEARREVARFAEDQASYLALTEGEDLLDQNDQWRSYQLAKHQNAEQAKVVERLIDARPGQAQRDIETLQAEQDEFVDGLAAAGVSDAE